MSTITDMSAMQAGFAASPSKYGTPLLSAELICIPDALHLMAHIELQRGHASAEAFLPVNK